LNPQWAHSFHKEPREDKAELDIFDRHKNQFVNSFPARFYNSGKFKRSFSWRQSIPVATEAYPGSRGSAEQ
jgi:hypothetical protein